MLQLLPHKGKQRCQYKMARACRSRVDSSSLMPPLRVWMLGMAAGIVRALCTWPPLLVGELAHPGLHDRGLMSKQPAQDVPQHANCEFDQMPQCTISRTLFSCIVAHLFPVLSQCRTHLTVFWRTWEALVGLQPDAFQHSFSRRMTWLSLTRSRMKSPVSTISRFQESCPTACPEDGPYPGNTHRSRDDRVGRQGFS